ncbi:MAG: leucine-rich repeat protein, partial [Bacteroidales bacterium]|nr:leucine-rich repeat protein [Bacteroidales bacterium]
MKQKLLLTITLWLTLLGSAWAQSNNALHFDGSNDYVDLPDFTTTHDFSQGFTFTAWVKWDAFTGNARLFEIGNGSGNVNNSIILRTDASSGSLIFQCANGTTNSEIKTDAAVVTTNTWHHVATTISSAGAATIYIDGTAVKSGSVSAPNNVTRANNWLGKSAWSVDNYFKGTMDEVSIWHKALTQADIEAIKQTSPTGNENKLAAYYNFNQTTGTTLTDATGNAKNGTLNGFALSGTTSNWVAGYTPPAANNSLHFDGTNDYVACPAINPTQFTVEAWVYPTTLGKDQAIISTLNVSSNVGMELHIGPDNLPIITINNNGSFIDVKGTNTITADTWTHLAATYNGTNLKLFINGTEAKSESYSNYRNSTAPVNLGKRYNEDSYYFSGRIDEVRIWDIARTQTEIADTKDNPLTGTESNLLAYYSFNQGTAGDSNSGITTLTDATTNAKHGTLYGFGLTGTTSNWVAGFVPATTPTYNLSATPTTHMLDAASGSNGSIAITSNTSWTISGSADWLQLSTTSGSNNGTVTFTTKSANTQAIARVAKYTISGTGVTSPVTFTVTQNSPEQSIMSISVFRGPHSYHYGNTTLSKFFSAFSYGLQEVTAIDIRSGDFTSADWEWIKANRENFTNLTRFAILSTVNSAADVPTGIAGDPIFNTSIKELHLAKVLNIGANAFGSLSELTTIGLPNVTNIQTSAFNNCSKLYNLMLGATPPTVAANAFSGCPPTNLRRLAFSDANGTLLTGTALNNAR